MAQQLEAALRRTPVAENRPPVTDPLAAARPRSPEPPRGLLREPRMRHESKTRRSGEPNRSSSRNSSRRRRPARTSTTILNRRWPACSAVHPANLDRYFRPPCPSFDGGGWSSRGDNGGGGDARCRAGHQRQFRARQRAHRARDPDDRAAHGAVAGAVDPGDDDVVHPHRRGAVASAHGARHRHSAAQRGHHIAGAVSHRLRHGAGAADGLRDRRQAARQQRDHRRAGLRARLGAAARLHGKERQRKGPEAVRRHVEGSRRPRSPRTCRCACWCRPS